jgi:hypothetical protein
MLQFLNHKDAGTFAETKPSRLASKGRLALVGASFACLKRASRRIRQCPDRNRRLGAAGQHDVRFAVLMIRSDSPIE